VAGSGGRRRTGTSNHALPIGTLKASVSQPRWGKGKTIRVEREKKNRRSEEKTRTFTFPEHVRDVWRGIQRTRAAKKWWGMTWLH